MKCPKCGGELSPTLKGAYAHYPDSRFCEKCVRFFEEKNLTGAEDCPPHDLPRPATTAGGGILK